MACRLIDRSRSYTVTGAPRLAGKNIVIGNGGGDMDTRGYVSAYDLATGKLAWRFFAVPGDPARGADEHPEITEARKTWGKDSRWDLGLGGNAYDGVAYDPELNVIYVGTSNGVPHPSWLRDPSGGDNLYLSSILNLLFICDYFREAWSVCVALRGCNSRTRLTELSP